MDDLDTFIKEIIDTKQLPGLTDDARQGLHEEMRDRLLDMINRSLIDALSDEKAEELSSLLDHEGVSDEVVSQFIATSGIDASKVTAKTLIAFRALYLQTPQERGEV